jgi:hypothetical protein
MTTQILRPEIEPEHPDVEPRMVEFRAREAKSTTADLAIAPLGLADAAAARFETLVTIDVETDRGSAQLPVPMRVELGQATGTLYHLTIVFHLGEDPSIDWHLEAGGHDATSRAAVLDLLIAMSGSGSLVLWSEGRDALMRVDLAASPLDESIFAEREFLTDVLIVEAWSGQRLSLPEVPDDRSARALAEMLHWIRTREMRVRFTSAITGFATEPTAVADELRLKEDFEYQLFGVWVRLGRLNYRVPVKVRSVERDGNRWRIDFEPQVEWLTAKISPPRRASVGAVQEIEKGRLPKPRESRSTIARSKAQERAKKLLAEWDEDQGPVEDTIRDEVRRNWPL